MAYYLVRAWPVRDRLPQLWRKVDDGTIRRMRPFGDALQHSLKHARIDRDGRAVWEEQDNCVPPLQQEREAVLNEHFADILVWPVSKDMGWKKIDKLPPLRGAEEFGT
jgi:hypothetical protein